MALLRFCLVVYFGALMEMLSVVSSGDAATITVNTTTDELNADADCSLREAVRAANTDAAVSGCPAGNGADEILVPAGTYLLAIGPQGDDDANRGDLDIRGPQPVTIQGAGAATTILDGNQLDRLFEIRPNGMAIIADVTIRNGNPDPGVGVATGGGILNYGVLTVLRSTIRGNFAYQGGGIDNNNDATLTLSECLISDNLAENGGGGVSNALGSMTATNSVFSGNVAGLGGGLAAAEGTTSTLMNCTIHDNTVLGSLYGFDLGGGIENAGTLLVTNGTVSGNRAERHGGGIANWSKGKTTLVNVTLTNNTADNDGDGDGDGGGVWNEGGLFSVKGTVLAGNHDLSLGAEKPDCFGKLASKRYNLVGNNAGCAIGKAKNLVGIPGGPINPLLGPLQNNGGPTMTHALLPMSPAKDGIPSRNCKDHKNKPLLTDQRGVPRPQGLGCDIGAVEQTP